jgi:hypothetical protein
MALMGAVEKQDANFTKALINQRLDLELRNIHGMNGWRLAHPTTRARSVSELARTCSLSLKPMSGEIRGSM